MSAFFAFQLERFTAAAAKIILFEVDGAAIVA